MSQAPSAARAGSTEERHVDARASVSLRGTTRGLEIVVAGTPSAAALGERLTELLAEAPGFFAGSQARVAIEGALPLGALACLEQIAARFALQLVEIGPAARRRRGLTPVRIAAAVLPAIPSTRTSLARVEDAPLGKLAEGSGPIPEQADAGSPGEPAITSPADAPPGTVAASAVDSSGDDVAALGAPGPAAAASSAGAGQPADAASTAASLPASSTPEQLDPVPSAAAQLADAACDAASAPVSAGCLDATVHAATSAQAHDAGSPAAPSAGRVDATAHAAGAVQVGDAGSPAAPSAGCLDATANAAPAGQASAAASTAAASDAGLLTALAAVLAAAGHQAAAAEAAALSAAPVGPRLVIGPVRSGRIVDHLGHLIIVGDVNPGAEVRAEGSIIVLGRLRGVAHAAIGRDAGCIIALSLQPQQLRIGRMVARAGDADRPGGGAEIAYATGETIVVERFLGRLPSGLAASM